MNTGKMVKASVGLAVVAAVIDVLVLALAVFGAASVASVLFALISLCAVVLTFAAACIVRGDRQ